MAKRLEEEDEVPGSASASASAKHKVIVILAMTGIVLLFVLLLMVRKTASVGQAVYVEQKVVQTDVVASGIVEKGKVVIWADFSKITAAKGDIVVVPLYLASASGQEVTAIDMKVTYDSKYFSVENNPTGEWIGKPEEIAADISAGLQVSLQSTGGMKSGGVFATIPFKVIGESSGLDISSGLSFEFVKVTGVEAGVKFLASVIPNVNANVIIVPKCDDGDGDSYGKPSTDQRACGKRDSDSATAKLGNGVFSDCDDAVKLINPGAIEVCDGKDNNCVGGVDEGLEGEWNSDLEGVCYGKKICASDASGKVGWLNSYEVTDVNLNKIMFSDGSGTSYTQSELYQPTLPGVDVAEAKCDFFDNDCDGKVNDGLVNCKIGGGEIPSGLLPTGNAFITYGLDTEMLSQKIDNLDVSLLYVLKDVRDVAEPLGDVGKTPYSSKVKGTPVWVCDSGVYYVYVNGMYEKHWYNGKKEVVNGMSVEKGKLLLNGQLLLC